MKILKLRGQMMCLLSHSLGLVEIGLECKITDTQSITLSYWASENVHALSWFPVKWLLYARHKVKSLHALPHLITKKKMLVGLFVEIRKLMFRKVKWFIQDPTIKNEIWTHLKPKFLNTTYIETQMQNWVKYMNLQ